MAREAANLRGGVVGMKELIRLVGVAVVKTHLERLGEMEGMVGTD